MIRFFMFDLKRILSGKRLVALLVFTPFVVLLVFSTVIAPMLFTAKDLRFNLAIFDEDGGEAVSQFINQMVGSQALRDIITVYPVYSEELGYKLVLNDSVSVLLHIPPDLFDSMAEGQPVSIDIISTSPHALDAEIITMTLGSALSIVGQAQNILESASETLMGKGVAKDESEAFRDRATNSAIEEYINRRSAIGKTGTVSLLGDFLPVEYYLSAIFCTFAVLAMLPLVQFTARDATGAIFRRGLLCGMGSLRFFVVRLFSGAVLVLVVLAILFPAAAVLRSMGYFLGLSYAQRMPALLLALLLTALCFSSLAACLAVWIPGEENAVWACFFLVLLMVSLGGGLIPSEGLPIWVAAIGEAFPFKAAMRSLSYALFEYNEMLFRSGVTRTALYTGLFSLAGLAGFWRKERYQ